MKTLFFFSSFALGMMLSSAAYMLGGVILMMTGLAFSFVVFGSLFVLAAQVQQLMTPSDDIDGEFALPA